MPSLSEHWSDGTWLDVGTWNTEVVSYKMVQFNSGNRGVEFTVAEPTSGDIAKITLTLTEKAVWKLAQFAKACGFSRDECDGYDWTNDSHHARLVGRPVQVTVDLDSNNPQYKEVTAFSRVSSRAPERPATAPVTRGPAPAATAANNQRPAPTPANVDGDDSDSLPF